MTTLQKVLLWLANLTAVTAIGVGGAATKALFDLSNRVSAIEGNRFTSSDGLAVWQEIGKVRAEIASIPRESPPGWFVQRFDKMEGRIDASLSDISRKVENNSRLIQEHMANTRPAR